MQHLRAPQAEVALGLRVDARRVRGVVRDAIAQRPAAVSGDVGTEGEADRSTAPKLTWKVVFIDLALLRSQAAGSSRDALAVVYAARRERAPRGERSVFAEARVDRCEAAAARRD